MTGRRGGAHCKCGFTASLGFPSLATVKLVLNRIYKLFPLF
jgi:hypothetical protein